MGRENGLEGVAGAVPGMNNQDEVVGKLQWELESDMSSQGIGRKT